MMRSAVLVGFVLLAGCAASPPVAEDAPPAAATTEVVGEGQAHYSVQVRQGDSTRTCCEESPSFELRHAADLVVEITWTATTPGAAEIHARLGAVGGSIVAEAQGPSPLTLTARGAEPATYRLLLIPKDDPSADAAQTFSWRAVAISGGAAS